MYITGGGSGGSFGSATVSTTGPGQFGYVELGAGTKPAIGLARLPYFAVDTVIGAKNSAAADKAFLSRIGADYWQLGNSADWNVNIHGSAIRIWGQSTFELYGTGSGGSSTTAIIASTGVQFGPGTVDHGGGNGVLGIDNAGTDPTTNPTAGGILFCSGGALKYRGSSGTVTTLGPA